MLYSLCKYVGHSLMVVGIVWLNLVLYPKQVLRLSQYLLLQMASPDALIRLDKTALAAERDDLSKLYFEGQHHQSIHDFLLHCITESVSDGGLLMQVRHSLK